MAAAAGEIGSGQASQNIKQPYKQQHTGRRASRPTARNQMTDPGHGAPFVTGGTFPAIKVGKVSSHQKNLLAAVRRELF